MAFLDTCCTSRNGEVRLTDHKWISTYLETHLTSGNYLKWLWCRGCGLYKLDQANKKTFIQA